MDRMDRLLKDVKAMTTDRSKALDDADLEAFAIERAVQRAVRQALIEHKQSGDPVVFCVGDEIRWVPAAEIVIPDLPTDTASS